MSKGGRDHFDEFEEHTLLKHLILDKYVKAWAIKLLRWLGEDGEVWFVDAFAGEGGDKKGNPGSPVIAARIAQEIGSTFPRLSPHRVPLRVLAIEKERERYERLCQTMLPFTMPSPRIAEVRHGTLTERLDQFINYVKDAPVLFFLDPFGVDGLLVDDLPKLLSGPHNEVFALFSDVGAKRLHATLLTEERDVEYEVAQVLSQPTFFPDLDEAAAHAKRVEVERSKAALRQTQVASQRILAGALGVQATAELDATPVDERAARLTRLYVHRLREAGARHVVSFPVRDARNRKCLSIGACFQVQTRLTDNEGIDAISFEQQHAPRGGEGSNQL